MEGSKIGYRKYPSAITRSAIQTCKLLLPSFLSPDRRHELDPTAARRATSVDGLRGLAAIAVMNYHVLYQYSGIVLYGFGLSRSAAQRCARDEDLFTDHHNMWLAQLPIFRLAYSGTAAVSVFYIISGFALSYRPLELARASRLSDSSRTIASSTFRRALRLLLPPVTVMFVTMLAVRAGLYEHGARISSDKSIITEVVEHHPRRLSSFAAQLLDWLRAVKCLCNIWRWQDCHPRYDVHLWTIPTELRGSLVLYLFLSVLVHCKEKLRFGLETAGILYVYLEDRWDVKLFFTGAFLADLSLRSKDKLIYQPSVHHSMLHRLCWAGLKTVVLIISLCLLSTPDFCIRETPGFGLLGKLIPRHDGNPVRFWPGIGALLLVALHVLPDCDWYLTRFMKSSVVQYFGEISFSLYIVHGPINHTFGYWIFPHMWSITGTFTTTRYVVGFLLAYMLYFCCVVWVADIVWRMIDRKSVNLAKFLQRHSFQKESL